MIADRALRALYLAAGEDIGTAALNGRWSDALAALDVLRAELVSRAAACVPTALDPADRARAERLTLAEARREGRS